MDSLIERLKDAAGRATSGEWTAKYYGADIQTWAVQAIYVVNGLRHTAWPATCNAGAQPNEANATYIALANPANILALIEALGEAEKELENTALNLRRMSAHFSSQGLPGLAKATSGGAEDCEISLKKIRSLSHG